MNEEIVRNILESGCVDYDGYEEIDEHNLWILKDIDDQIGSHEQQLENILCTFNHKDCEKIKNKEEIPLQMK